MKVCPGDLTLSDIKDLISLGTSETRPPSPLCVHSHICYNLQPYVAVNLESGGEKGETENLVIVRIYLKLDQPNFDCYSETPPVLTVCC